MDIRNLIQERRSIKKIEENSYVADALVEEAVKLAAYAPNHGMREPWRVIWIKKDRLLAYAEEFANIAFKGDAEKKQKHIDTMVKLSGILIIVGKRDRRQRQLVEDILAVGGYMQTLSLFLHDQGVGTCIKTPPALLDPQLNQHLNISQDEVIYGQVFMTSLPEKSETKERKNENLLTEY